ncbi:unnamed protein product [Absidia cylindrospora]
MPLLKVMDLPNRGRGYVATQDIEAGTLIHVSKPLAMVVNQEWMPETCMGCFDFSYPKRMKTKALATTEETQALLQWWRQQQQQQQPVSKKKKKNNNNNTSTVGPLCHVAFCTDQCKQDYLSTCANDEWCTWLTCMYRLENYNPQQLQNSSSSTSNNKANDDLDDPATILHDDIALRIYLDKVWDLALGFHDTDDDFDDADRTMCKFIASCLVKHKMAATKDEFDALWTMQDNELGHFRHFYQQQQQQQHQDEQDRITLSPSTSSETATTTTSSLSSSISTAPSSIISSPLNKISTSSSKQSIPAPIQQTMQLYRHFISAMTQPMTFGTVTIPPTTMFDLDLTSDFFRGIYYREMANSFGLWEQQQPSMAMGDTVTDDLELLGFGIYPSAVYFNHSCQANVIKLRHESRMHFYTREQVRQGDEVCISYGNVDAPLIERQQRLLDHYYFTCACTRCRVEQQ